MRIAQSNLTVHNLTSSTSSDISTSSTSLSAALRHSPNNLFIAPRFHQKFHQSFPFPFASCSISPSGERKHFKLLDYPHGIATNPGADRGISKETQHEMDSELGLIEQSLDRRYSHWAREALDELPESFTITDPSISGHPIVFASRGFLKMTGYRQEEVVGMNGRVFQGPRTNRRTVMEIREAIHEERAIEVNIVNYHKDGTPFWMLFRMHPVFDKENGRVVHFVAVQVPISQNAARNAMSWSNNRSCFPDLFSGSCRKEVGSDSSLELGCVLSHSDSKGSDIDPACEASDMEKQKAITAIHNVLSVLTHYSGSAGRLVCGERCSSASTGFISSSLNISLGRIKQSFVLIDPHLPNMPIVYASDTFFKLTGYDQCEVLGHNYRLLDGIETDTSTVSQIWESIEMGQPCTVHILNYRKDGSSFWNKLHMSPVRNASGKIAYFLGVQMEECHESGQTCKSRPELCQLSVVGAVKVAVRSSSMTCSSSSSNS